MIQNLIGIDSDFIIIGLLVLVIVLLVLVILNMKHMKTLQKNYRTFMTGSKARSLEDTLIRRIEQIEDLIQSNNVNEREIEKIKKKMKSSYCKMGMVKYDAFPEMGGKLSFAIALIDEKNDGFIINSMYTREGCFSYTKDIFGGNSAVVLSNEENEALDRALAQEI